MHPDTRYACKRHNVIVKHIAELNKLNNKRDKTVVVEPRIRTSGLRTPVLIIKDGTQATVIDIQVVGNDENKLNTFNSNKVNDYRNNTDLIDQVKSGYGVNEVDVIANTFHYKSFINLHSFKQVLEFDILKKSDFKLLVNKVLMGGVTCLMHFTAQLLNDIFAFCIFIIVCIVLYVFYCFIYILLVF